MLGFRYREVGSDHPFNRNFFLGFARLRTLLAEVFGGFEGHCRLHGRGLKAPVGTPSCRKGNKARSGSPHDSAAEQMQSVRLSICGNLQGLIGDLNCFSAFLLS